MARRRRRYAAIALCIAMSVVVLDSARTPRPRRVGASIDYWAARYDVDVHLARAVAWVESGNNPSLVSSTGARGVMQVEPGTWLYTERLIGHRVARTTDGNVQIGVAYLHHLLREFHGNRRLALAAYNQGPEAVRRLGVYRSADRYAANVLALSARL